MSKAHRVNQKSFFGRPVWKNSTRTLVVHPLKYYYPESIEEVREIVEEAITNKVSVRAVGSGHSYSRAPEANGLLVDISRLDQVEPFENTERTGKFFIVGAGIRVKALNKKLDKFGCCLPAMGGIDHQSISGAVSTGTHGSSLEYGAMSKMIRSVLLVTRNPESPEKSTVLRVEPSSGFSRNAGEGETLICDDDFFNAAVVSLGLLGLICSYVVEAEPMYYLMECKKVMKWPELKTKLQGDLLRRHRSVMVLINPYSSGDDQLALLTTHDKEAEGKKNLMLEKLKRQGYYRAKRFVRSFQYELVSRFPVIFWISVLGFNLRPDKIGKLLDTAIKSQQDEEYYNKGYEVMYQGLDYIKERAYDCEFAVPLKNDLYLEILEDLMTYLRLVRERYNIYITSPIGLRFVAASDALITPEHGQDICYIDTPILLHIYGRETILDKIQAFMCSREAIPHWGKINSRMDKEYVKSRYPRLETFLDLVHRYNRDGLYSNQFTRRLFDV